MQHWVIQNDGSGAHEADEPCSQEARPTHSPDGVDLTLIRWMLSLTPLERLEVLQATIRSIMQLRGDIKS